MTRHNLENEVNSYEGDWPGWGWNLRW